jgi:aspartate/methionine/tyrosine aminotransferase
LYAEENIMVFPGEFFASELPFVRLTICCNNEKIGEFLERFKRFCSDKLL